MYALLRSDDVLKELQSSVQGLPSRATEALRARYGFNELPGKKRSLTLLFLSQFHDVMIYILLVAMGVSIVMAFFENGAHPVWENFLDAEVIAAILLLNALLGFLQEYKAEEAIAMLRNLTSPQSRVRRDGGEKIIPSRELVPGDIVILSAGDKVSADGRIIAESHFAVNESSLTGESSTSDKTAEPLSVRASSVAEMRNMVFSGTLVTEGFAEYVVTATGLNTEIGKIAKLVSETRFPETPLERRMTDLGRMLGAVVLALCAAVFVIGAFEGMPYAELLLIAVSLAVSAVPEGLPAVVTVCMAMGVRRMAKRNALVRRLESLETLGSVTVICADKTGTITENRMKVVKTWRNTDRYDEKFLAQIAASCNRAQLPDVGDPTEVGLLVHAVSLHAERLPIDDEEVPFSSEAKYMQTRHVDRDRRGTSQSRVFLKGAPEKIFELCDDETDEILKQNVAFAGQGLRVLAFAERETNGPVRMVGLIAMEDPPRATVKDAVAEAKVAGIRTIMITGDNPETAQAIAGKVGIEGGVMLGKELSGIAVPALQKALATVSVFARVSPEHKLKILEALKAENHIVAMSGDGVNDAPALKGAHVGVAMGRTGTEVAREASSIVLADDDYATIVAAVREGRRIYDNIKKFVLFLLRANFDELLFISMVLLLGMPLPYHPIHILWINLMTDAFPALALGVEPAEEDIMKRPPRNPREHLLAGQAGRLLFSAVFACSVTFLFFLWQLSEGIPIGEARTTTLTLAILFELFLAHSARSERPLWTVGLAANPWMFWGTALPLALQILLLFSPLRGFFHLTAITPLEWAEILLIAFGSFLVFEMTKIITQSPFSQKMSISKIF